MRKLFYLGFCFVLVAGVGCAITNYELITDNDQVHNGQGTGVVNTAGMAHIIETQIATLWPDGSDEFIWFVDQKSNGDRSLSTYNNYSTLDYPVFHDDKYCNPDHQGCAIITAEDPETGDASIFDYQFNPNCSGLRSLTYVLSTTRYYGECGRMRLGLQDRLNLLNMGRFGQSMGLEGLFFDMNRSNLSITLDNNAGFVTSLPVTADVVAFMAPKDRKVVLDLTNPMLGSMMRSYADFLANNATGATKINLTYNGISMSFDIAGNDGQVSSPSRVLAKANAHY